MPSLIQIMTCRQAIVWSNAGILLIGHIGKNFNEILIEIHIFSFEEIHSKISSGKWQVFLSRPPCVKHFILRPNEVSKPWDWASSTGLTAVSKFKPCLPAQWAVGTHRKGSSRMEQVTSRMNWPIRNSTQIRNLIYLIDNTIMWSPSVFFSFPIGFTERKTILVPYTITSLRNFHGLSPWHRPSQHWHFAVTCNVTMGKFNWGVRYVITFQYVQFWIWLAADMPI